MILVTARVMKSGVESKEWKCYDEWMTRYCSEYSVASKETESVEGESVTVRNIPSHSNPSKETESVEGESVTVRNIPSHSNPKKETESVEGESVTVRNIPSHRRKQNPSKANPLRCRS
jgi:hypothetical protein